MGSLCLADAPVRDALAPSQNGLGTGRPVCTRERGGYDKSRKPGIRSKGVGVLWRRGNREQASVGVNQIRAAVTILWRSRGPWIGRLWLKPPCQMHEGGEGAGGDVNNGGFLGLLLLARPYSSSLSCVFVFSFEILACFVSLSLSFVFTLFVYDFEFFAVGCTTGRPGVRR